MSSFIRKLISGSSEPPPLKLEGKAQELCLQASTPEARHQQLLDLGQALYDDFSLQLPCDLGQFVQMHIPSHVTESFLQGTSAQASLAFWIALLQAWATQKGPLACNLKATHLDAMAAMLTSMKQNDEITHTASPRDAACNLQETLLDAFQKKEDVTLLFGHLDCHLRPGHAIPVRFSRQGNKLVAYILNKGAGSSSHILAAYDGISEYTSLLYFPIEIPIEHLQSEEALQILQRLVLLQTQKPSPRSSGYSAQDVYDLFSLLGTFCDLPKSLVQAWQSKTQRGNSCAYQAIKIALTDYLILHKIPHDVRSQFFFLAQSLSLLAATHAWHDDLDATKRQVLTWAFQEYAQQVQKRQPSNKALPHEHEHFLHYTSLAAFLPQWLEQQGVFVEPLCLLEAPTIEPLLLGPKVPHFSCLDDVLSSSPMIPTLEASPLPATLEHLCEKVLPQLGALQAYEIAYHTLLTLPSPAPSGDLPYGELSEEALAKTLTYLQTAVVTVLSCPNISSPRMQEQRFLAAWKGWILADALGRRCEETKMEGFSLPYWPDELGLGPSHFHLADEIAAYATIIAYCQEQRRQHPKALAFYSYPAPMRIGEAAAQIASGKEAPLAESLSYLLLFTNTTVPLQDLWLQAHDILPKTANILRVMGYATFAATLGLFEDSDILRYLLLKHCNGTLFQHLYTHRGYGENLLLAPSKIGSSMQPAPWPTPFSPGKAQCHIHEVHLQPFSLEREFLTLSREPTLQVFATLNWLKTHYSSLTTDEGVQRLTSSLLHHGLLQEAIEEEPSLTQELHSTLQEAFEYLAGTSDHKHAFMLAMLAYSTLSIAKEEGVTPPQAFYYIERLASLERYSKDKMSFLTQRDLLQVAFYSLVDILDQDNIDFLSNTLAEAFYNHSARMLPPHKKWVWHAALKTLYRHESLLASAVKEKLLAYAKKASLQSHLAALYQNKAPQYLCSDGKLITPPEDLQEKDFLYDDTLQGWVHKNLPLLILEDEEEKGRLYTRLDTPEGQVWHHLSLLKHDYFLDYGDSRVLPQHLTATPRQSKEAAPSPILLLSPEGQIVGAIRASSSSSKAHEIVALEHDDLSYDPLAILECSSPHVYVWSQKGQPSKAFCPTMKLRFYVSSQQGIPTFSSVECPGYTLVLPKEAALHLPIPLGLLLANNGHLRWALPRHFTLHVHTYELIDHLTAEAQKPLELTWLSYDRAKALWQTSSVRLNALLAVASAMRKDYEKALQYLQKATAAKSLPILWEVIETYRHKIPTASPEEKAFGLHLGLAIARCLATPLHRPLHDEKRSQELDTFWADLSLLYNRYLRASGSEKNSRIPLYIQLTPQEELTLLAIFKQQHDKKAAWNNVMILRQIYLENPKQATPYSLTPTRHTSRPWMQKLQQPFLLQKALNLEIQEVDLPLPDDPLHLSTCEPHLSHLLQKALATRQQPFPTTLDLDLWLLMRQQDTSYHEIAKILWQVSQQPKNFAPLWDGTTPLTKKLWQDIAKAACEQAKSQKNASPPSPFHTFEIFTQYAHQATCTPLSCPPLVPLAMGEISSPQLEEDPLRPLFHDDLIITSVTRTPAPLAAYKGTTPLENHLLGNLNFAGDEKIIHATIEYCASKEAAFVEKIPALQNLAKKYRQRLSTLKASIETLANLLPDERIQAISGTVLFGTLAHRLKRLGRQELTLQIDNPLLQALYLKDPTRIQKHNPFLSSKEIQKIFTLLIEYALIHDRLARTQELIALCRKIDTLQDTASYNAALQQLGRLAHFQVDYNPSTFPEILVYTLVAGHRPRPEQQKLLTWIFSHLETSDTQPLLVAFQAGGGKSAFLIPIIAARLARQGKSPLIISPPALCDTDQSRLNLRMLQAFNTQALPIEASLSTPFTVEYCQTIHRYLENLPQGSSLVLHPETYLAIHLQERLALLKGQSEKIRHLSASKELLRKKFIAIIDECRINLSPLTQAKIGLASHPLEEEEIAIYILIYSLLVDPSFLLDDGTCAVESLGLLRNTHRDTPHHIHEQVRKKLACNLAKHPHLAIPEKEQPSMAAYWLDKSASPTPWMQRKSKDSPKQSAAYSLLHEYLGTLYPLLMDTKQGLHHGPRQGLDIDVPYLNALDTGGLFENPMVGACLSIHGTLQRGLSQEQVRTLLLHMQSELFKEQTLGIPQSHGTAALFATWTQELSLQEFVPESSTIERFHSLLAHNKSAILWFLQHHSLKGVTYSRSQIVATPAHLLAAMPSPLLFSAYPGHPALYGIQKEERHHNAYHFQATILEHLVHKSDPTLYPAASNNPQDLFETLLEKDPSFFDTLGLIVDIGALFAEHPNTLAPKAFLHVCEKYSLPFKGVIFFPEGTKNGKQKEGVYFWQHNSKKPVYLKGPTQEAIMRLCHLDITKERIMVFYDAANITGADLPTQGAPLILAGKMTLGQLVQGAMRARNLLQEKNIRWCVAPETLATLQELYPRQPPSPQGLIQAALQGEAATTQAELSLAAIAHIDALLDSHFDELLAQRPTLIAKIELAKKHRKGLVHKTPWSPTELFSGPVTQEATARHLESYVKIRLKAFGFEIPKTTSNAIKALIATTAALIATLPSRHGATPLAITYRHQHQKVKTFSHTHESLRQAATPQIPFIALNPNDPSILDILLPHMHLAQKLFDDPHITSRLYLSHQLLYTVEGQNDLPTRQRIDFFLVIIPKGSKGLPHILAISPHEAAFFKKIIPQGNSHHIALFTAQGLPINATTAAPYDYSAHKLDACTDIALFNGNIHSPQALKGRLATWPSLPSLCRRLKETYLHPEEFHDALLQKTVGEGRGFTPPLDPS